jgi:hypothetical protein
VTRTGFLSIDDLVNNQGELALTVEFDSSNQELSIAACTQLLTNTTHKDLAAAYLSLCTSDLPAFCAHFPDLSPDTPRLDTSDSPAVAHILSLSTHTLLAIFASKHYKPVARKIRPIKTELPSCFCIIREIKGNLLQDLPTLSPTLPDFELYSCYTEEWCKQFDKVHAGSFLLPKEHKLIHHFMCLQNSMFAWTDLECSHFCEDFFPPIEIPTIPHKLWVQRNIPIPPGIYDEVCWIIKNKINASIYELSNSSYCSCWFCIIEKDRKLLRLIHSLEPLNQVTIKHSGIMPFTDQIGEHFTGCTCGGMLDLYIGYDKCSLSESSHDLTTFQSPFGVLCLVTLPMGWTNSVPIFHDDVTYISQPEIPKTTVPYIDNIPICRPAHHYPLPDGDEEQIPKNVGICCFVWEHFKASTTSFSVSSTAAAPSVGTSCSSVPKKSWQSATAARCRDTCVADDSSLRQAIRLKLKGMKRARQDRQPSLTWRQVTRLQLKTIVERSTAVMPLCKARRELSH